MASRIARHFEALRLQGRKGFIPFVTAGDPDLESSLAVVLMLAELGADVIELGVPFSDPVADGPTIQRSSQRALAGGVNVAGVLKLVKRVRETSRVPIVLFSYLNPLMRYGIEALGRDAAEAGVDGILITDVVDEEAARYSAAFHETGIDLISLIAPTTSDDRLRRIAENSRGFLYAVSRAGVTGARSDSSSAAETLVRRAREHTALPIAVGFGISSRDQISEVWRYADATVVGSAIVSVIENRGSSDAVDAVARFVSELLPGFAKSEAEL